MIKLDYSLNTPKERLKLVEEVLEKETELTKQYLESLADYLVFCMEKEERKEKKILTENRLATVNKRETSFEGLVSQFENGEDGVYNIADNNKHVIFQPKISITKKDLEEIPELEQTTSSIKIWEDIANKVEGKEAFIAKKALIETRKDQYVIKNAFKKPVSISASFHVKAPIPLDRKEWIDENGDVAYEGVSLMNPKVCSAILCNYSKLKDSAWGVFDADTWYLMEDFDIVCKMALQEHPMLERIVLYKIDGLQNVQIQEKLEEEFGIKHSLEYISSLWRKKIPLLIASAAEDQFLDWYYLNIEKGTYKKCSRCGEIKLAHNKYFSKNKTSKDKFYSICKDCRNKK